MKRCCICVFWDKDGTVREYVSYYIKGLQEIAQKVYVVVNGVLSPDGIITLEKLGVEIINRDNIGLDFGAWKDCIDKIGYNELSKYDELILTNTTCYGPIYSLSEMFNEMESRDCDFWGVTKHPKISEKIIEHIQSYFLVFNKKVVLSEAFKSWWKNVKYLKSYKKIIRFYEVKLTKYFEDFGFKSDSYIDLNLHKDFIDNPMFCSDKLLYETRIPLIKRKAIVLNFNLLLGLTLTHRIVKVLQYLKNNSLYDIDMIYSDIIATQPMSEIHSNLHLNYILPSNYCVPTVENKQKIALILYIYYEELVEYCLNYAKSLPENSDIYIVSSKESTLAKCKEKDYIIKNYNVEYRLKPNKGRDVSAYLVTCADIFDKYDLICCMHDKMSKQDPGIYSSDFMYLCFECNLKNKDYVNNVIGVFNENEKIGMLTNPPPKFRSFAKDYNWSEMGANTELVKGLYSLLNLTIPFDMHPVAPFGSMFWIRSGAIKPIFRKKWEYEDFPNEPLPSDGTISHAIERIYPSVAQEAGYMSGWIMPEDFATIYVDNLTYNPKYKLLEKIFSVRNSVDKSHKIITILGFKLKIRRKIIKEK